MPTQICQTNSGPNQGPWPAALPQPSPALLPLLSTTESLRETDKTTLIPSVKGISTHSILQGTTLGALMETETPFLWKGLIFVLLSCSRKSSPSWESKTGRPSHLQHGSWDAMLPGTTVRSTPPPCLSWTFLIGQSVLP